MSQPEKQKILYIITQGAWGGAQRYIFDLATNLSQEFDITVAVGEPNGAHDLQSRVTNHKPQVKVEALKHLVRPISPIHDILAIFELRKLYNQIKPDIVHLNSSKAGILGSLALLSPFPYPLSPIYTAHGWVFNEPMSKLKKSLYTWLEKFTARFKKNIIVLSESDKRSATDIGIAKNKLSIIPIGIGAPEKPLSRAEARSQIVKLSNCQIDNEAILIGVIAGLYKTKGVDILIDAINHLNYKLQITNYKFIIIGAGPEKENLKLQITNYKLQNHVYLLGFVENAEDLLPAFDIFVLPSRKEGLPYVLLEAKQAGLPIIATKVGGIPTLIDDQKNGLLVEANNPSALADKINFLIENKTVRTKFAELLKNETDKYSLDKMISKTTDLYHLLG